MENKLFEKINEIVKMYSERYDDLAGKGSFEKAFRTAYELDQKMADLGIDAVEFYEQNK
jgi:hypothetical protein